MATSVRLASWMVWLLCGLPLGTPRAESVLVSDELQRLQAEHGFELRGLEQTLEVRGRAEGEDLIARLRLLLERFDYVIVQTPDGGIERIIILGEREPYVPPAVGTEGQAGASLGKGETIVLPTSRQGDSHLVSLELEGAHGRRVRQILLVDTGAEQVVLPDALRSLLGMAQEALIPRKVQTANGLVDARLGRLAAIWLGEQRVADVEVAFVEGERLGAQPLLGMSLLKRFRMTIDDARNELRLEPK